MRVTIYQTERLVIRQWTDEPADQDRIHDLYSRPEVTRWLGANTTNDPALLLERWRAMHERDRRFGWWALEVRDAGVVAGSVIFKPLPGEGGEIEVGWHLHPDSWGHGYATEAGRWALAHGFAHGIPVIYAVVRPDNERSLAVVRRLGMRPLGRTDRWYDQELELFEVRADELR